MITKEIFLIEFIEKVDNTYNSILDRAWREHIIHHIQNSLSLEAVQYVAYNENSHAHCWCEKVLKAANDELNKRIEVALNLTE